MSRREGLMDAAGRLWDAAWGLDEIRGDTRASEWTAQKVRDLMRYGRADDRLLVTHLADALERRLVREREGETAASPASLVEVATVVEVVAVPRAPARERT